MTKANNATISCLMWREMIVAALQYATADSINNLCITTPVYCNTFEPVLL